MADPLDNAECKTCRFYEQLGPSYGECHLDPPRKLPSLLDSFAAWPKVKEEQWCGEYEAKQINAT